MRKQIYTLSFLLLCASTLDGCAVAPPDVPVCIEDDISTGFCVHTMSGRQITVDDTHLLNGKTWLDQRPYMLLLPIDSWVELKKFIIDACKLTNCSQDVASWQRSVEAIDGQVEQKTP